MDYSKASQVMSQSNNLGMHWLSHAQYAALRECELSHLESVIPRLFGYHLVHLGHADFATWLDSSLILHRCRVAPDQIPGLQHDVVCASPESLPFKTQCIDVLVLTHLLESCDSPKAVLKECYRVLLPYGHLVITGINPWSWVGIKQRFMRYTKKTPVKPVMSLQHVVDWLDLLDFQILETRIFESKQPSSWFLGKIHQLKALMPAFATGYLILAVKKTVGLTPIRPQWSKSKKQIWANDLAAPLKKTKEF
jgi:SAM-dependent methyltransferase